MCYTEKQQQDQEQKEKEALEVLNQIVAKSAELLPNVVFRVWDNGCPSDSAITYTLERITLTKSGKLKYEAESHQLGQEDFFKSPSSGKQKLVVLTPSIEVIRRFHLKADHLRERLAELD